MKILINIPEDIYRRLKAGDTNTGNTFHNTALESISNGVVLLAGHGRLIDAEDVDNHNNPTGDLISREALKEALQYKSECIDCSDECCTSCFYEIINNASTVEPERLKGHWKNRSYYRPSTKQYDCKMSICSECGEEYSYDNETGIDIANYSFCPNCGADMRKGGAEA